MNLLKDPVKFVIFCGLVTAALLIGYNALIVSTEQEVVFVSEISEVSNHLDSSDISDISENSELPQSSAAAVSSQPQADRKINKININTADKETLMTLKGVGEVLAQRIIDYRTQNGYFQTIEDIKNVSGIGEQKFITIKSEITV